MELGDKLKALRKSKGLSLKKLSELASRNPNEKLDISVSFLSDIENGRSNPSLEKLKLIAKALDTPIPYFIENSNNTLLSSAIEDIEFLPIAELLNDFKDWNIEDKKELLYYLKAKKVIRNK
ncbi:MAG: helix-turn-helix transcriptional regulator [Clostridium sp.]|nr:helix-turn-helix transcriptional regulator [Clostridium sp.]